MLVLLKVAILLLDFFFFLSNERLLLQKKNIVTFSIKAHGKQPVGKKKKKVRPETEKTDLITDSIFQVESSFRQPNPISIGSGFGSQ